jgi:hypothetical protein
MLPNLAEERSREKGHQTSTSKGIEGWEKTGSVASAEEGWKAPSSNRSTIVIADEREMERRLFQNDE